MESYISKMSERITKAPCGHAFVVSDFTDLMDYETAKKNILRLEQAGKLRRDLVQYMINRNTANYLMNMPRRMLMKLHAQ